MRVTVNDFRRISHFANYSIYLDRHQQLKKGHSRCVRLCQSILHQIPLIQQLPCLRQQRLKQHTVKRTFLLAIAQEYGAQALYSINHYPNYWAGHKILNGRKIKKLLQLVGHTYQPLGQPLALPQFIIDELCQRPLPTVVNNRLTNTIRSRCLAADAQEQFMQKQISDFLLADPVQQTVSRQQLHQALTQVQISDERFKAFLALSTSQRLKLYAFMVAYRRLPGSCLQEGLPLDRADRVGSRADRFTQFPNLPLLRQLSILAESAASRTGYRRKIDLNTQQLLIAKGLPFFKNYYSRELENRLTDSDRHLKFAGDHLYSTLGLSAHLVTRELPQGRELSLVFGGFKSHPTLLGKFNQARAILNNFFYLPWTAALYREAAEIAKQVAHHARQQGFEQFTVSGHSLGGSLAEYALGQSPELIQQARVFQAFHVLGKHRWALSRNPLAQHQITSVEVKNDWVTSPLVHRKLSQVRTVVLEPRSYSQVIHSRYDRRLFKAALYNLSRLSPPTSPPATV